MVSRLMSHAVEIATRMRKNKSQKHRNGAERKRENPKEHDKV